MDNCYDSDIIIFVLCYRNNIMITTQKYTPIYRTHNYVCIARLEAIFEIHTHLQLALGRSAVNRLNNNETWIWIQENSVGHTLTETHSGIIGSVLDITHCQFT